MRIDTDVDVDHGAGDVNFFFHQKMRNWYLGNYKKRWRKIFTRLNRRRENQNLGSKWTPLMHLSVKSLHFPYAVPVQLIKSADVLLFKMS